MKIITLPAFSDNYIWMLHNGQEAIVVDPGDALPVIQALEENQLQLAGILITHHHSDHTAGIEALRPFLKKTELSAVFGPAKETIPSPFCPLNASSVLNLLGLDIQVLDVPGHTLGHLAYYIPSQTTADGKTIEATLFSGDALFSAGSGRLFEGTPAQMLISLDRLAQLPSSTQIYCAHEYTLSNLRFACAVEPDNEDIKIYTAECEKKRAHGLPTIPSTIEQELKINPFLRSRKPSVIKSLILLNPNAKDETALFATLRSWKDNF